MISWELSTEELNLVNSHVITPRMVAGSVFAGFKNLKTCSYVGFHHDHASLHLHGCHVQLLSQHLYMHIFTFNHFNSKITAVNFESTTLVYIYEQRQQAL